MCCETLLHDAVESRQSETDEDWHESELADLLGGALKPDGGINFERLHEMGESTALEELFPEMYDEQGKILPGNIKDE